jgi:putative FmdB family regulatory protein
MPTYEYHCTKCDHEFELSQSITDKSLTTCPKPLCRLKPWGKGKVKKKISAGAGLIFKGSGFYITDYRSDNYKEGAKKESGADKPADSKPAETKSGDSGSKEAKSAKPKEAKTGEGKSGSKKD